MSKVNGRIRINRYFRIFSSQNYYFYKYFRWSRCFRYLIGTMIMSCRFLYYRCTRNALSLFIIYGKALYQTYKHQSRKSSFASEQACFFFTFQTAIAFFIFQCWYFRYLLVALIALRLFIGLHVPTKIQMYRQKSENALLTIEVTIAPLA